MMSTLGSFLFPYLFLNPLLWNVAPITNLASFATSTTTIPVQNWYVEASSSAASPNVVVVSGNQASSTTTVLNAPYGVSTEINSVNGKTYATTTPLTASDVAQMQQQQAAFQNQMNTLMQDQQKLFQDMWPSS